MEKNGIKIDALTVQNEPLNANNTPSMRMSAQEQKNFIKNNEENIQTVVANPELNMDSINFGEAQTPSLDTYADNVDTMKFLEVI